MVHPIDISEDTVHRSPPLSLLALSLVSMIFPAASPLLPLARFPALIWIIAAGLAMPKRRFAGSV
jgi:hypothetical protein